MVNYCQKCGNKVTMESKFCEKCGFELNSAASGSLFHERSFSKPRYVLTTTLVSVFVALFFPSFIFMYIIGVFIVGVIISANNETNKRNQQ